MNDGFVKMIVNENLHFVLYRNDFKLAFSKIYPLPEYNFFREMFVKTG